MQTVDDSLFFHAESDLIRRDARQAKAERMKNVGDPICLHGSKVLRMFVSDQSVWTAESNATVVQRDLETGKKLAVFHGHKGPVSALLVGTIRIEESRRKVLISGSWDKHIRIFDAETRRLLCCTLSHSDFVKTLLFIPALRLLVSGGSDKEVRFWDLSQLQHKHDVPATLKCLGSVKGHSRPVECLAVDPEAAEGGVELYSADSMGVIMAWKLRVDDDSGSRRQLTARVAGELKGHSTGVTDMRIGEGELWTASSDGSVLLHKIPVVERQHTATSLLRPITHPSAVKSLLPLMATLLAQPYLITGCADEKLRVWDVSAVGEPGAQAELKREVDVHSHDITALEPWTRRSSGGKAEAWVVSCSLDGTIRKWKLHDLLLSGGVASLEPPASQPPSFELTEEEERELLDQDV